MDTPESKDVAHGKEDQVCPNNNVEAATKRKKGKRGLRGQSGRAFTYESFGAG